MGMNATASLFYGVKGEIPERARLEIEEPEDGNNWGELVIDGIHITMIYSGDMNVGAGALLAHSYWGDDLKPVPLEELDHLKQVVDNFLDDYNVPGLRGLFLSADFS
jgi:hypothetical protein